jgi:pyridoxine/pyridoxamine 5'-phosphate oxidase
MTPDRHPWAATLPALLDQVWARLARGVHDRHAHARNLTLATVSPDGAPQVRTVVLRAVDRVAASLRIYTDAHSAKMGDLRANPLAAVLVWDGQAHLQIRALARVQVLSAEAAAPLWAQLSDGARLSYGGTPQTGAPIPEALAYAKTRDPAAFRVLDLQVQELDILHLGPQHRRARFSRSGDWAGEWCVP